MKLNEKDVKYFKDQLEYYKQLFGLGNIEITFLNDNSSKENNADFVYDFAASHALIRLNKETFQGNHKLTCSKMEMLNDTAFHEIFEIILQHLVITVKEYPKETDIIENAIHGIVYKMLNFKRNLTK